MPFSFPLLWQFLKHRLHHFLKSHTKPATSALTRGALADLTRSKADLIIENALLRQQLIVLKRQVKRPQLTPGDRFRLVVLASWTPFWKQVLHIVQPDTLLRWHRDLFRQYWRRRSRSKGRKPRIAQETIALIKEMAQENRTWGAERIRGELLKLGMRVSKRSIQRYLPKNRLKSSQNWANFLKNHAGEIWAYDFTVVHDLLFRPLYILSSAQGQCHLRTFYRQLETRVFGSHVHPAPTAFTESCGGVHGLLQSLKTTSGYSTAYSGFL